MELEIKQITVETTEEEEKEVTDRRKALVSQLIGKVKSAKQYHKKAFDQMREDMEAVFRGYADKGWNKENYIANILHRHVHQRTAALYAKNPKPVASRRKRLDYKFWDGDEKTLAEAYQKMQSATMNQMPPNPQDVQIVQDYESVQQGRKMLDKVAESLELLFSYSHVELL